MTNKKKDECDSLLLTSWEKENTRGPGRGDSERCDEENTVLEWKMYRLACRVGTQIRYPNLSTDQTG